MVGCRGAGGSGGGGGGSSIVVGGRPLGKVITANLDDVFLSRFFVHDVQPFPFLLCIQDDTTTARGGSYVVRYGIDHVDKTDNGSIETSFGRIVFQFVCVGGGGGEVGCVEKFKDSGFVRDKVHAQA